MNPSNQKLPASVYRLLILVIIVNVVVTLVIHNYF